MLSEKRRVELAIVLAVGVGGAAGALLRTLLLELGGGVPIVTLIENAVGSGMLGALFGLARRWRLPRWANAGLGPGLCGSFTSMSLLAFDAVALSEQGFAWSALYIGGSWVLGLLAVALGMRLTRSDEGAS